MKIASNQNLTKNNPQNFSGVNIIQVSKKAFSTPEDAYIVAMDFSHEVNKITKEWPDRVTGVFRKLGLEKFVTKTLSYLEQPLYVNLAESARRNGASINWLSLRTQIPIKPPLSQDYHSFYVFTKNHKNAGVEIINPKHYKNYSADAVQQGKEIIQENPQRASIVRSFDWLEVKLNENYSKLFEKATLGEPVKKFVIEDLSELPNVFKEIAY